MLKKKTTTFAHTSKKKCFGMGERKKVATQVKHELTKPFWVVKTHCLHSSGFSHFATKKKRFFVRTLKKTKQRQKTRSCLTKTAKKKHRLSLRLFFFDCCFAGVGKKLFRENQKSFVFFARSEKKNLFVSLESSSPSFFCFCLVEALRLTHGRLDVS